MKFLYSKYVFYLWLVSLGAVIVGSLLPAAGPPDLGFGFDKVVHLLAYMILSLYPVFIIKPVGRGLLFATVIFPMGFMLEYMQKNVEGRMFSPEDMIANNIGIILGIILGLGFRVFINVKKTDVK